MSTRTHLPVPEAAASQSQSQEESADPRMRVAMQRRAQARKSQSSSPEEAQPLDPEVRGEMESKIGSGQSFADVRVHADSSQTGSAHALAQGSDLHFAKDKFQPETKEGKWLLAHELSHVVQQRQGATARQPFAPDAARGQLEREADRAASTVVHGGRAEIALGAHPGVEQHAQAQQAAEGPHQEAGAPTSVGSSTEHPEELQNQSYAHGGFMGAAGEMLQDSLWCNILQALMPDVFAAVKDDKKAADAMKQMENNPVMAAYGASKNLEHEGETGNEAKPDEKHQTVPIEWDVWLDKEHPDDLSKVKIAHGAQMATLLGQIPGVRGLVPKAAPSVKAGLPAMGGGDANWVETFGKAIAMFRAGGKLPEGAADKPPEEQQELLKKLAEVQDPEKMIATAKEFLSKSNGGGVVLDIKSTYSSPGDVAKFVASLGSQGIDVRIVGSFRKEQLGDLNKGEGGDQREGSTRPVTFVHSIDGLEGKAKGGELVSGDHVMFNAADLLMKDPDGGKDAWKENPDSLNRIAKLVEEKGLKIGIYVQETAAGPSAIKVLTRLCNEHPELFSDGFAHGNVSGSTEGESEGSGMGAQNIPAFGEKVKNKLT